MDEHSDGFKDPSFEVYVTTGSVFQPMSLEIHFFTPKGGFASELLKQHHLTTVPEEQRSQMVCRYSAPVGLMFLSTPELKKSLKEHIEQMLANPQYSAQTTAGNETDVPASILNFAIKYYNTTSVRSFQ
jgi:hypothetical protein